MMITTTSPYRKFFRKTDDKRSFKRSWKVFGWYFTISNCRVKRRNDRDQRHTDYAGEKLYRIKMKQLKANGFRCPLCGRHITFATAQLHHILPFARFSDLRNDERNMLLLCRDCHTEIHINPFQNIKLMEEKADELGIDLDERYDRH